MIGLTQNTFVRLFIFIYLLAVLGLRCCPGFSLVVASGGHSSLKGRGFSCFGSWALRLFSNCGTWAQYLQLLNPRVQAQYLWFTGLAALRDVRSSQTRD